MDAWRRAGFDAYPKNNEQRLGVDWGAIRRKHMKFSERFGALAQAPWATGSWGTPAPWSAETRRGGRSVAQAPVNSPSGPSDQWHGWQGWSAWGQGDAPWTDAEWKGGGKRFPQHDDHHDFEKRGRWWA